MAQSVVYEQDGNGTTTTPNLVAKARLHGAVYNDVPDVSGAGLPQPPDAARSQINRTGVEAKLARMRPLPFFFTMHTPMAK